MPGVEFNPELPVVVRKEIPIGNGKTLKVGTYVDWQAEGWREDRVAALVRSRYLDHTTKPIARAARKQIDRKATARRAPPAATKKAGHAPAKTGKAARARN
jgi:hypothetical protein